MPVTINIITGVLGSGKTTLLQHLLADQLPIERPAIVVGEFAEEGLDAQLLTVESVPIRQLTATGVGDTSKSFLSPLKELVMSGRHNRIYLETSGVAEVHRIIPDLYSDPDLVKATVIGPTVTVIDAGAFEYHDQHFGTQFWSQIEVADIIVINKVDRVSRDELAAIEARIKERNPVARRAGTYMGRVRRGEVNSRVPEDFTPRILQVSGECDVPEFEAFVYRTSAVCYDRVMFGHLLLNLPDAVIARFKGKLRVHDKTYCVNGFPGQLDWDNTPVFGDTSIALIGLRLLDRKARLTTLLDEEIERQRIEVEYG